MTTSNSNWTYSRGRSISIETLRQLILGVPELSQWPEVEELLFAREQNNEIVMLDWQIPSIGCEAVGGLVESILPAVAAFACLHTSIIVVDDMLDEEPDGIYQRMGSGRAANLALALQSATHLLIEQCPLPAPRRTAAALALNRIALITAAGQELDVHNLLGEDHYWQVVQAKSTPFYGMGLEAGAYLGGATTHLAKRLYDIGVLLGEAIQISDDLEDAFKTPANADWVQGRNNLAILYALTADYAEKDTFLRLKPEVNELEKLDHVQQILIRSGAVSYCLFQLLERHQLIRRWLKDLSLARPELLERLFNAQLAPFQNLLEQIDPSLSEKLLEVL